MLQVHQGQEDERLKRWTDELKRGDQVANLYRSEIEQAKILLDLLRWMGESDKMVFLTDSWDRPVFRHAILDAAVEEGRLSVLPSRQVMFAAGRFDPEAFHLFILNEISRSREEGHGHTVLVWEADWAAGSDEWEQVAEFGSRLALAPLPGHATAMAQYSTTVHSEQQADMLRRSNQLVLETGFLARNFWIVSKSSYGGIMTAAVGAPSKNAGRAER